MRIGRIAPASSAVLSRRSRGRTIPPSDGGKGAAEDGVGYIVNGMLAIFGPVPPVGDPTVPGLLIFVIGVLGFASLAVRIGKVESIRAQWIALTFVVALLSFVMIVGLLLFSRGLRYH